MDAIVKRECEKEEKYRLSNALGIFVPLVFSPWGSLGRQSLDKLMVALGAKCNESCEAGCRAHGRPDQKALIRNLLISLSFAQASAHADVLIRFWLRWLAVERGVDGAGASRVGYSASRALRKLQRADRMRWRRWVKDHARPRVEGEVE